MPHTFPLRVGCAISTKKAVGVAVSPVDPEEKMYRSAALARESSSDVTIEMTFALLALALSSLTLIDAKYMANLLMLF
jgi:hypothetical protein